MKVYVALKCYAHEGAAVIGVAKTRERGRDFAQEDAELAPLEWRDIDKFNAQDGYLPGRRYEWWTVEEWEVEE